MGNEEFYVIDGELIDDDGKIFKTGDYVKKFLKKELNILHTLKLDVNFL